MTQDQEALISKARNSLRAAKLFESNGLLDFAASRAYYTMFYIASALLLGKGLSFSKHGSLLAAFGQHLVKTGEVEARLHRYLINAEDNRITGDYSTQSNLTQPEIASMISQAEEFIALADQMLGAPSPVNHPSQSDPE